MCEYEKIVHVPEFVHVCAVAVEEVGELETSGIVIAFQIGQEDVETLYIDEFIELMEEVENG